VQAKLLEHGRSAEGATGTLRALSAMVNDAVTTRCATRTPGLGWGFVSNDPRVRKAPRPKRMWTMQQMHAFAAAAARARDEDRDEPTELERWRAIYAESMILLLSDCGLRFGGLMAVERAGMRPGWLRVKTVAHEGRVLAGTKTTHHLPEEEQWRDIPLPASTEAKLRALPPRIDTPVMFTTPTGKTWRERNWRRDVWEPTCEVSGLDPRPQEFRASWESVMAAGHWLSAVRPGAGWAVWKARRRSFGAWRLSSAKAPRCARTGPVAEVGAHGGRGACYSRSHPGRITCETRLAKRLSCVFPSIESPADRGAFASARRRTSATGADSPRRTG
jgi:hypothetical protein